MNSFVVTLLLAVLSQSNASQKKPTEQPCTGPALVGSWQLVKSASEESPAGGSTAIKHVTTTHFFVLSAADATGLVSYGHGGPYTLSGGTYTESITHGFGSPFSQLRGMKISFQCSIEGDVWHSIGEIGGQTFDERWRRLPASTEK
jgi:hypothetical protein